jgi:endogenous inhibitor of DNA gyrase (YacG/DUF329 family)
MKLRCALCGRSMRQAAVYVGAMPVGPTCAKRAGLIELGRKKAGAIRLAPHARRESRPDELTADLFEEAA